MLPPRVFDGVPYLTRVRDSTAAYLHAAEPADCDRLAAHLQAEFDGLLLSDAILRQLVDNLNVRGVEAVVFGGWPRDQIMRSDFGYRCPPRDIDLVLSDPSGGELLDFLDGGGRLNIFGGIAAKTVVTDIDLWRIEDTFLIRLLNLPREFATLPSTTVFTINSVVFFPRQFFGQPSVVDGGAIAACRRRMIAFQAREIPFTHIQVGRAVTYAAKLAFSVDDEVKDFIRDVCSFPGQLDAARAALQTNCPSEQRQAAETCLDQILAGGGLSE
ncbi:MAG TPA: hypothetical protein VHY91_21835 [Pirellulales bacterium]|jgi:hypothetical protein|nr:hypothetical protein [Pirellulales bacterium]